jgi:hypothetical protein
MKSQHLPIIISFSRGSESRREFKPTNCGITLEIRGYNLSIYRR